MGERAAKVGCSHMTGERDNEQVIELLTRFKPVLQALADGDCSQNDLSRLEAVVPFPIVVRGLVEAVNLKFIMVSTEILPLEPKVPLSEADREYIEFRFRGMTNGQICKEPEWNYERLNAQRKRVFNALGAISDYQVVVWEARRRQRLEQL